MLNFLSSQSTIALWLIFLIENFAVTALALLSGWILLRILKKNIKPASGKEWSICFVTNVINTAITYLGFWFWQKQILIFSFDLNWRILTDLVAVFMLMDLFMYAFHYAIHHFPVYKIIHSFHHQYEEPIPIDLFVLHPVETVGFGALWLSTIMLYSFNFYAVLVYLIVNVGFGIVGHLGVEPLSIKARGMFFLKCLGTSSFHHTHHQDTTHNFGFYTNVWDKLFNTYKDI